MTRTSGVEPLLCLVPVLAVIVFVTVGCSDEPESQELPDLTDTAVEVTDGGADADGDPVPDIVIEPTPEPVEDGEACETNDHCISGLCLTEADGFPAGHCATMDCEDRQDCNGMGRACLRGEFNGNLCVIMCGDNSDCRPGYECEGAGAGGYCYPAFVAESMEPSCETTLLSEESLITGFYPPLNHHRLTFDISDDATSFAAVVYNRNAIVLPTVLTAPDGEELSLLAEYAYFMVTGLRLEHIAPLLIPAGPQWTDWVQAGTYTLDVGTDGERVCYFVLENHGLGEVIDLNFYFVGVPGLNAESADDDPDFQEMLDNFSVTIEQGDFRLGQTRYYDVTGDVEEAFEIIRVNDEVYQLMAMSRAPGQTAEEIRSVNVFFVRDFSGQMMSVLGVAAGIPGVMGIHGREGTGVIFSAAHIGSSNGNRMVGQVLAHEVGHFLGLEHTTEIAINNDFDHLEDTPECPDIERDTLGTCPDFTNLMFPIAAYRELVHISVDQLLVLRSNPLVRTEP